MNYTNEIITALWLRRAHLCSYFRGFLLFKWTQLWLNYFFDSRQVTLGIGTRVQSLRCFLVTTKEAKISVGSHCLIYENARLEALDQGQISVGDHSIIGDCRISCRLSIQIGSYFLTSWNVFIQDHNPHPTEAPLRMQQMNQMLGQTTKKIPEVLEWSLDAESITIGDSVWLGANVTILKGAKIGNGCIVAANSVVTRGLYPDNTVLAGTPARVIKTLKA